MKPKFSVTHEDESIIALTIKSDHNTLATFAVNCVERVLPYFDEQFPPSPSDPQ